MKKQASPSPEALLSPERRQGTGLYIERLFSPVEVVNYLLATYTTDNFIVCAIKELESYKRGRDISAALYAEQLFTRVLRCQIVNEKKVPNRC